MEVIHSLSFILTKANVLRILPMSPKSRSEYNNLANCWVMVLPPLNSYWQVTVLATTLAMASASTPVFFKRTSSVAIKALMILGDMFYNPQVLFSIYNRPNVELSDESI
jgi:hypothetical protein